MSRSAPNVLITGGGIGIGRATAETFAQAGYRVIVTDILDAGQTVADAIVAAGGQAEFHPLDVRSTADADRIVADVESRFGALDCIVANAGIAHRVPMAEMTDQTWDHTLDIDLKGMLRVIRPALAGMKAAKTGSIICLSSIMGVAYGWDEHVHYSTAKAGVVGLVRGLAVELARAGIRVNGIAPGYIRTAQLLSEEHSLGPAGAEKAGDFIPMGRIGEPGEIADVALFLASQAARYITGQVIVVDGGLLVGRY
ncbi:SDR family oxidoreductase [Lichenihabitans sp. PAMC28606]|uniref:SDR family NAD(P)-dependent oxidoreductase n=1 Tax=Lichenihabitans sp. PAMC28606 TaxID=2880932 RepID=UPI001D0B795C|nr:SDR family NAD(P)-dependent oxidoreductase [Lichenihabitans sp. PAMC28606]UDL93904.1 SDR family oxidoreductase [Lichenihabitans sp. PAMC28606]